MEATRQQVIDDLIHDCHFSTERIVTADVAAAIVAGLHDMIDDGREWAKDYLDDLAAKGGQKVYADWRRRYTIPATTKKGTDVDVPAYASVRERDDDGRVIYTQMRLLDMTLDQLKAKRAAIGKQRDTLSVEYRLFSDLVEIMEADPSLATAGDALAVLEAA